MIILSKQRNNIISVMILTVLTASIFSISRYSDASLYVNDMTSSYEGLSLRRPAGKAVNKSYAADNKLGREMEGYSNRFIRAAFARDEDTIAHMLAKGVEYIRSSDGSSFIRSVNGSQLVEGYMATDKKLLKTRQQWCIIEADGTVVCGMNVYIKGIKTPQRWDIHFKKAWGKWKVIMLENGL